MEEWHLDKKVTVGIIAALLFNAGSSVWWASKLDVIVRSNSEKLIMHDDRINSMQLQSFKISERLARIDENLKNNTKQLGRIERKVSK